MQKSMPGADAQWSNDLRERDVADAYVEMEARERFGLAPSDVVRESDNRSSTFVASRILIMTAITTLAGVAGATLFSGIFSVNWAYSVAVGLTAGIILGVFITARLALDRVDKISYDSADIARVNAGHNRDATATTADPEHKAAS